jgi:hypothetical protein
MVIVVVRIGVLVFHRLFLSLYSRFVRFILSRLDLHDLWDLSASLDRSVI